MEPERITQVLAEDFAEALAEIEAILTCSPDLTTVEGLYEHSGQMNRAAVLAAACAERLRLLAIIMAQVNADAAAEGLELEAIKAEAARRLDAADGAKSKPNLRLVPAE